MLAHTHIKINTPNGVAYITWNGNDLPSEEQLCFFEKMAEKASKQLERQSSKGKKECAIGGYFRKLTKDDVIKELNKLGWVIDKYGWVKW